MAGKLPHHRWHRPNQHGLPHGIQTHDMGGIRNKFLIAFGMHGIGMRGTGTCDIGIRAERTPAIPLHPAVRTEDSCLEMDSYDIGKSP